MNNTLVIDNLEHVGQRRVASRDAAAAQAADAPAAPPRATDAGAAPPLRWLGSSILHGCNIHHDRTVLRVDIDLGGLHGQSSASAGAEFADRFISRFLAGSRLPPTFTDDGVFQDALRSPAGAPFEEVLLEAILAIERRLAFARNGLVPIGMSSIEPVDPRQRHVQLVWETPLPELSRAAARLALAGVLELLPGPLRAAGAAQQPDFDAELASLERRSRRRRTSLTTAAIALAAHQRGIPCESIGGPHMQLGHGAVQQLVYSSVPGSAPLAATLLSCNKRRTTLRLRQLGLPVPRQIAVDTVEGALAAATTLGYPVAVKPQNGKQGNGVSVGLMRDDEIRAAFERAKQPNSRVLVETSVPGRTCRLLVIGGRFVAALQIAVPAVVGDGKRRIDELIEILNRDPMRDGVRLCQVQIDADLLSNLARHGRALTDVLPAGVELPLRTAANASLGGVPTDVTDRVHPSHRELAERASAAIGLELAGIDVVSPDIGRPCDEVGTQIIEVNARPGLEMHVFPGAGRARDVASVMLEMTFPPGTTGRLPTALVLGRRGARAAVRQLDARLCERGLTTGLITRDAALVAGQPLAPEPPPLDEALAMMQRDIRVQALVVATTPDRAVARGLALESADVVALLARERSDTADEAQAVTLALRAAHGAIVVESDNDAGLALLHEMISTGTLERTRLILVGPQQDAAVEAHLAAGGMAVLRVADRHGEHFVVRHRGAVLAVLRGPGAPALRRPGSGITRARTLAAALAWALDRWGPKSEPARHQGGTLGTLDAAAHSAPADPESTPGDARVPWQGPARTAWLGEVESWLAPHIRRLGQDIVGPLRCVRDHAWAIVVRVPCSNGPLFFKATDPRQGHELAILEALGPHWSDRLPTVLASDRKRGWFLMADHGCTLREHLADSDAARPWLDLLPRFAQVQMADMPAWRNWSVPDRSPDVLPAQLRALLADPAVLRLGQADGMTPEQRTELCALLPEFEDCCKALRVHAPALNHGDLHDRNVLVSDGQYRFIDFSDASVTHPLCVLLLPCQKIVPSWFDAEGRRRLVQLCEAYIDGWRGHRDAATLRPLLGRALWVAHVVRALTWEQLGRAAGGEERQESLRQVASWLNLFVKRRALLLSASF